MLTRTLIFCLFIAGIFDWGTGDASQTVNGSAGVPEMECGPNEMYVDSCNYTENYCRGTPQETSTGGDESSSSCHRCVCKRGYARNSRGECVSQANCNRCRTRNNQEYLQCGTACPLVCGQPVPQFCTLQCVAGCFCVPGYIRDPTTNCCRPIEDCPPSCGPNEVFSTCPSPCPEYCNEAAPENCIERCDPPNCVCTDGYVRDRQSNRCVSRDQCTGEGGPEPCCGENEVYLSQGGTACPLICGQPVPKICIALGVIGCFCKDGFIRSSKDGPCVPIEDCPPDCGPNAYYTSCVSNCPAVCNQTHVIFCDQSCRRGGCQCSDGFILSPDRDSCISMEECNRGVPC